ncbi:MAG: FKBP-type peptidyl-prolyl cis-trans isomerase, partial [Burkholderiales bacterium]
MPSVQPDSFLTLHYRLAGPQGDVVNTFGGKPATLSLGRGELAPAVEQQLIGLEEGARKCIEIGAGEAFGQRNPEMVQWVARDLLDRLAEPDQVFSVGEVIEFPTPDGRATYAGTVRQIGNET